jgi:hypothetical protein
MYNRFFVRNLKLTLRNIYAYVTRIANVLKLAKRLRHVEPSRMFYGEIIYGSACGVIALE